MELRIAVVMFCWIHLAICLTLIGIFLAQARGSSGVSQIGFPFLPAAGLSALLLAMLVVAEWSFHGGKRFDPEGLKFRINGPYWWVYVGSLLLPFLPLIGAIGPLRRRPWIDAGLALLAMIGPEFCSRFSRTNLGQRKSAAWFAPGEPGSRAAHY